ncbi:MAG: hypothetical protein HC789_09075 [Microcoleus sp. CSU_2_2]|nr:hypothetical protein [Microcoleus sp. SU_5_3]NJS10511.1 hypothetical protein [Microcoleus sp. CSU_2_2]
MLVRLTEIETQQGDRHSTSGTSNRLNIKSKIFSFLTICVAVAGCLGTASGAIAQEAQPQVKAQALVSSSTSQPTAVPQFNAAQQEEIAQMLLGFIYFVLPVGVALTIFLHDKYAKKRSATLNKQIEVLEISFHQTPQH